MTRLPHLAAALLTLTSCGYAPCPDAGESIRAAAITSRPALAPVPGPAGLLAAAAALGWARALRKRTSTHD